MAMLNNPMVPSGIRRPRPTQGGARKGRRCTALLLLLLLQLSMGFRSYIRETFPSFTAMVLSHPGAVFWIERVAYIREFLGSSSGFTAMVFSHPGAVFWIEGVARAGAAARAQFWYFSVLHCHGVFPSGSCLLNRRSSKSRSSSRSSSSRNRRPSSHQQQEEKVAKITSHPFLWVSEVTLGSFWARAGAAAGAAAAAGGKSS